MDYHHDPILILYYKSNLRLVVDLQTNVKAMQSQAYAQKVKITNLQQMAKTIIYVEEHGFDTQREIKDRFADEKEKLSETQTQIDAFSAELKTINEQIHFTGQYLSSKRTYTEFLKSDNKKLFRQNHSKEIQAYEEARRWLKEHTSDENIMSLNELKEQKATLQKQMDGLKTELKYHRDYRKELECLRYFRCEEA